MEYNLKESKFLQSEVEEQRIYSSTSGSTQPVSQRCGWRHADLDDLAQQFHQLSFPRLFLIFLHFMARQKISRFPGVPYYCFLDFMTFNVL